METNGGLWLTRAEVDNIAAAFGMSVIERHDLLELHWMQRPMCFRCTVRMGQKFGGWEAPRWHRQHHRELRLALGLSEIPLGFKGKGRVERYQQQDRS